MTGPAPRRTVQSVERVFALLELIMDLDRTVSLSELASSTSLPLPSIHRLLRALVPMGYIKQLPNHRYMLGPGLIRIGATASKQLSALAQPWLTELADRLGETSSLALLDGDMVLYVAQAPSVQTMRMFTDVGHRVHAHDSGVGKAILAQLSDDAVRRIVARAGMPTPTERSIGKIEALISDLETIRIRGYSIDDGEQYVGVRCLAVAVPGAATPTAISVSGPTARVDDSFTQGAVPILHEAARSIGESLEEAS